MIRLYYSIKLSYNKIQPESQGSFVQEVNTQYKHTVLQCTDVKWCIEQLLILFCLNRGTMSHLLEGKSWNSHKVNTNSNTQIN